jgi:hypothetical protein
LCLVHRGRHIHFRTERTWSGPVTERTRSGPFGHHLLMNTPIVRSQLASGLAGGTLANALTV